MSESIETVKVQAKDTWRMKRFSAYVNRFKWAQDEEWCDSTFSWIDSVQVREFYDTIQIVMNRFTCDTIQRVVSRFIWSQRLW